MHYNDEAVAIEESGQAPFVQEVEVVKTTAGLEVKHTLSNLSEHSYTFKMPKGAKNIRVAEEDNKGARVDLEKEVIQEGKEEEQTLLYDVVQKDEGKEVISYEHPLMIVKGKPTFTTVHIVDRTKRGGTWITGLPRLGTKSTELLDYTLFAGVGKVTDLLWQKEETPLTYEGEQLSLFGKADVAIAEQVEHLLEEIHSDHMTVVLHGGSHNVESERFVALPESEHDRVKSLMFTKGIQAVYNIPFEEKRLASVVASIITETPIGDERAQEMYQELNDALTDRKKEQLVAKLKEDEIVPLDAKKMDQVLSTLAQSNIKFFEKNIVQDTPESLLLYDERKVAFDLRSMFDTLSAEQQEEGQIQVVDGLHRIQHQGEYYYPMKLFFKGLGYDVTWNEQSIYVKRGEDQYRFSLIDPFYVYDERRFNLSEPPYLLLEGQYYIEEQALKRIFKLVTEENEEQITFQPIM